jgi:ribonuclease P protein component
MSGLNSGDHDVPADPENHLPLPIDGETRRRLTFPEHCRLKRSEDFRQLYDSGQRAGDQHLLIFAALNQLPWCRIGLSVSKKHGNAVCRNRRKRLLREAFRLTQHQLPAGLDLVLIPRIESEPSLIHYHDSLLTLTIRLAKRLRVDSDPPVL